MIANTRARLSGRHCSLGNVLLFIFFASAGAAGGPVAAVLSYPALFGFLALLYLVHLSAMLVVGRAVCSHHK